MELDIEKGLAEVQNKTEAEIEFASAQSWANKAAAAYSLVQETSDLGNKIAWLLMAEDMYAESVEHSAKADNDGGVLKGLKEAMQAHREAAVSSILSVVNIPRLGNEQPQA